jgi:DNA-binding NarL/FixJ family response regulator
MTPSNLGPPTRRKFLIVDDHEIVRKGVRSLIETVPEWTACGEFADGQEALKVAQELRPDVVVLDISMPKISGIDLITSFKRLVPDCEILVLTMYDSQEVAFKALRAGARGYVAKNGSGDTLLEGLKAVSRHQNYFSPEISETLLHHYLETSESPSNSLPFRQRQIVKLVAEGYSNKQIAATLKISIKTVETHRSLAMRRIGAKSSADLALYAARNQLVQL